MAKNIFPDFEGTWKNVNKWKSKQKTSFAHFLQILIKKEFVYIFLIEFLYDYFINLNESKFMLSELNTISLIR